MPVASCVRSALEHPIQATNEMATQGEETSSYPLTGIFSSVAPKHWAHLVPVLPDT